MHVLEHTPKPAGVFSEVFRVLKPGGFLFVDVPFFHGIHHAPHDYFRYTPYALESLAKGAGMDVVEIRPSGGYFRALAYLLEEASSVIHGNSITRLFVRITIALPLKGLGWLIQKLQYPLDLQDEDQKFTCGYHCIFMKPCNELS